MTLFINLLWALGVFYIVYKNVDFKTIIFSTIPALVKKIWEILCCRKRPKNIDEVESPQSSHLEVEMDAMSRGDVSVINPTFNIIKKANKK